jgi:hypothetical protein
MPEPESACFTCLEQDAVEKWRCSREKLISFNSTEHADFKHKISAIQIPRAGREFSAVVESGRGKYYRRIHTDIDSYALSPSSAKW